MNLFQSIYCNQYEELVRSGRDRDKAHKNGIIIITVSIVVNLFSIAALLIIAGKAGFVEGPMHQLAENAGSARGAGKLIALLFLAGTGVLVWFTFGRPEYYTQTISEFKRLPPNEQKSVAKKGAVYFLGSIGFFLFLLMVLFIAKQ